MNRTCFSSALAIVAGVALAFMTPGFAAGQARPAKAWAPSLTPDGQPNLEGVWGTGPDDVLYTGDLETGQGDEVARQMQGRVVTKGKSLVIDPPDGLIPYQPWAKARREDIPHFRAGEAIGRKLSTRKPMYLRDLRPQTLCVVGAPRMNFDRDFKVVQTPGYVIMVWEWVHGYRVIPLDGRPHVSPNVKLTMGDARGHWEGNTLVVETTNENDWDWFDAAGTFHSDEMTAVERYKFDGPNNISYQVTVTDPKVFTRPWTAAFSIHRIERPNPEIFEESCVEGNRGIEGILGRDPTKQR